LPSFSADVLKAVAIDFIPKETFDFLSISLIVSWTWCFFVRHINVKKTWIKCSTKFYYASLNEQDNCIEEGILLKSFLTWMM